MRFLVRPAGPADLDDLQRLVDDWALETSWPRRVVHPRTREDLARGESAPLEVWIARDDAGRAVGFATAHLAHDLLDGPGAWLSDLYVRPEARRHRLATRLVSEIAAWARTAAGATWLTWHTGPENDAGRRFYASLGAVEKPHLLVVSLPI